MYLAVVIDPYSRMVIGCAMGERMTADLVCDALRMALLAAQAAQGCDRVQRLRQPVLLGG